MARSTKTRLASYQRRYRELAAQLADLGYISAGSITRRYTRCTNPNCRCHHGNPHGPYWQWSTKVAGKTVTKRLDPAEAQLYQDWINNDRHLRQILAQMRTIAAQAGALLLQDAKTTKV